MRVCVSVSVAGLRYLSKFLPEFLGLRGIRKSPDLKARERF